jgi:hypothetical protein
MSLSLRDYLPDLENSLTGSVFTSPELHKPRIDRDAVAIAIEKFLTAANGRPRPLRWFADLRSAVEYVAHTAHLVQAYWWLGYKSRPWKHMTEAFAAGLFFFRIAPEEVVCVPRPALWFVDRRLHREEGAAIDWATERYFYWRGIEVPDWIIDRPGDITAAAIGKEANAEIRRCMLERFGFGRYLRESGGSLIAQDRHGKLWLTSLDRQGHAQSETVLEVQNGTREPDGTYRQYFLSVPADMRSATEAVAWTYGLSPEQYDLAVRT